MNYSYSRIDVIFTASFMPTINRYIRSTLNLLLQAPKPVGHEEVHIVGMITTVKTTKWIPIPFHVSKENVDT